MRCLMPIYAFLLLSPCIASAQTVPLTTAPANDIGPWQMMQIQDSNAAPQMWLLNTRTGEVYMCVFVVNGNSPGGCILMPKRS